MDPDEFGRRYASTTDARKRAEEAEEEKRRQGKAPAYRVNHPTHFSRRSW